MRRARSGFGTAVALAVGLVALALPGAARAHAPAPDGTGPVPPGDTVPGTVSGRVVGPTLGEPVATALVRLVRYGAREARRTLTGRDGRYRFDSVPPGQWRLTVTTLDHEPFEAGVRVPAGGEVVLDAVLQPAPIELSALIARGERSLLVPDPSGERGDTTPRAGPGDPRLRALGAGPGASSLARAIDGLRPRPPSEPGSVLYVRGGVSDLKQVFLDGAPVYAPYHLGGLMEAVSPGVIRSGRLYTGGAPLAYDGGLSYVLDLRTRRGDEDVSTGGHLDLLGAGFRTGGSAGDVSYLLSGRRTHGAASDRLLDGRLPYGYQEALARIDLPAPGGDRLAVTGFVNRESVLLDDGAGRRASWGNRAAVVRYGTDFGGGRALLTAAASRFDTRLPVPGRPAADRAETDRIRVALDMATDVDGVEITGGAALNRHRTLLATPHPSDSSVDLRWRGRALTLAGYGAATFRPGEDVDLRAGLRATVGGESGATGVAPRVALTWRPAEGTRLRLSTGRYHQVLEAPQSTLSSDLDAWTEFLTRSSAPGRAMEGPELLSDLRSASASHATVRLDHAPRPELDLGLEGHFKTFHGLDEGRDLHASGADVWATYGGDDWKAWAGYSLAWTWSDRPPEDGVRQFSGRQLLSAGGRAPLPSQFRLSARVRATSGMPFTAIPVPEEPARSGVGTAAADDRRLGGPTLAGSPPDSYLRLDLTLSREMSGELFGSDAVFRPYLRLLNALDRRDALFFQVDPDGSARPEALDTFPVLPVLGLELEVP